jgi:hypothetical protein
MQNSKLVSDLLAGNSPKLVELAARLKGRTLTAEHVRTALPAELARHIASAGLDKGRLTIGVTGAAWASRVRYQTDMLRKRVSQTLKMEITSVRIRVVPPV